MTPSELMSFIAGLSSGAAVANADFGLHLLKKIFENADMSFRNRDGTPTTLKIEATLDLKDLQTTTQMH